MKAATKTTFQQLIGDLDNKKSDPFILCQLCKAPITKVSEKTVISHLHQYSFTNPAAVTYTINCYRNVPGCNIVGTATEEHSWFHGHRWQLAICTDCHEHLGWYYERKQRGFFGLIQSRVIESPA